MTPQHLGHETDPRDALAWQNWLRAELGEAMATVIWRRYGMGTGSRPLETQAHVGKAMNVTGTRIGQREAKALRMLRHPRRRCRVCALPHGGNLFSRILGDMELCTEEQLERIRQRYPEEVA